MGEKIIKSWSFGFVFFKKKIQIGEGLIIKCGGFISLDWHFFKLHHGYGNFF